jgi:serine/threonine protein kinase
MVVVPLLFVDTYPARKILEVAKGIEYIHSEGVVHGDLRGVFYSKLNILRC